jgi:hypothetical protein
LFVKDFIEIGYNEEVHSLMFRFRKEPNLQTVPYEAYPEDADIFDLRDRVNASGGTWFTLYDDKMITMSKGIFKNRNDERLMSAWASMIGVYFVRMCEQRLNRVDIIDIIHLWGISNFEDIFKFTFDLKVLGHAMCAISPHEVTMDEMRDIIAGKIGYGSRYMYGIIDKNVTVREGAYHMVRNMLPGPVSFDSDLWHQLVMWDTGDNTRELAESVVNLDNYVICRHLQGDNHSIMLRKMFVSVAYEKGDYIKREFNDLSRIRVKRDFSICGVELAREVCCILRKLSFSDVNKPIGLCEQVPMFDNYVEFENEVRQTEGGRMFNTVYSTFL